MPLNNLLNSLDHYKCREIHLCSYYWMFKNFFYFSDAWQMFKTWHQAELFQKFHDTWENLSKTPVNILRASVWWTENSVKLSEVIVPSLEIKVNYRVKWAFLFLLQVQVATHCWKWSCFQSLHYSFKERNYGWTLLYLLPINNVSSSEGGGRTGTWISGRSPRHVNAQEQKLILASQAHSKSIPAHLEIINPF